MSKRLLAAAACALARSLRPARSAQSFQPFVVKDIRVEGMQRTEAGTVFSYLPVKVGETMTEEKAQQAIRALYATGFFKDVRLEVEGDVLVVVVEERPAIAQIDFVGVKEFDDRCAQERPARGRPGRGPHLRPRAARAGRAGTEAPVPVARPVRRRGADHGHAAGAQPRRHQHSTSTKARSPRSARSTSSATRPSARRSCSSSSCCARRAG